MSSSQAPRLPLTFEEVVIGTSESEVPIDALRQEFPSIRFVYADNPEELRSHLPTMDAFIGYRLTPEEIAAAPHLKWVQILWAGVEHLVNPALAERNIVVTNAAGLHAENISEHVLGMMLAFARGFPQLFRAQLNHQWQPPENQHRVFELPGQTAVIVGLGAIGRAIAERASAFGMRVIGVRRRPDGAVPRGIESVVSIADVDSVLPEADHVIMSLPLTPETRELFSADRLGKLKDGAYFYNVGRGATVDQNALIARLRSGQIAGAGLDVVTPEPLPADSPLWDMENVILTGHTAGRTPRWLERALPIVQENLRRLQRGEAPLNEVDVRSGY